MRTLMGFLLALPVLVTLFFAPAACGAAERDAVERSLGERLREVIQTGALRRARVSALVVRERDGHVLFAHRADRPMVPASNMKILTALAALDVFGPTHQFETVASSPAPPDENGVITTLVVRGGGDPVLTSEDWWRFSADLAIKGVRRIAGDLVLDDSLFDRQYWHPAWGRTSSRSYHAPVGALTANYGSFIATVAPGAKLGDPVRVVIDPPVPYLRLQNGAVTVSAPATTSLVVDRSLSEGVEIVNVGGTLRSGAKPKPYPRSVLNPARYAGAVLRRQLEAVGIQVDGSVRVGRGPEGSTAHELMVFKGRPLAEIVRLFVKFSNNAIAETLVKQIGLAAGAERGSWQAGVPAMRSRLASLGLLSQDTVLVDGSGLSYENRVSPRDFVRALQLARDSFKFGPELVSALPIAASDGTLKDRAEGALGEVRAKTGLLNGVMSLSGFAQLGDGERAVFSFLTNGYRVSDERAMQVVDRFAAELVRDTSSPGTAAQGE